MPMRLRTQLQRQLEALIRKTAAMKTELKRAFEPERRLRVENELAHVKQETVRIRRELRRLSPD
jgi:hypothetical protein